MTQDYAEQIRQGLMTAQRLFEERSRQITALISRTKSGAHINGLGFNDRLPKIPECGVYGGYTVRETMNREWRRISILKHTLRFSEEVLSIIESYEQQEND